MYICTVLVLSFFMLFFWLHCFPCYSFNILLFAIKWGNRELSLSVCSVDYSQISTYRIAAQVILGDSCLWPDAAPQQIWSCAHCQGDGYHKSAIKHFIAMREFLLTGPLCWLERTQEP